MRAGITFWPFNSSNSTEAWFAATSIRSFAGKCRFCPAASSESYSTTPSAATFMRVAAVAATERSSGSDVSFSVAGADELFAKRFCVATLEEGILTTAEAFFAAR